jgi:hypothetical protein
VLGTEDATVAAAPAVAVVFISIVVAFDAGTAERGSRPYEQ